MMQSRRDLYKSLRRHEILLIRAAISIMAPFIGGFQYVDGNDYNSGRVGLTDELHVLGQIIRRRWHAVVTENPIGSLLHKDDITSGTSDGYPSLNKKDDVHQWVMSWDSGAQCDLSSIFESETDLDATSACTHNRGIRCICCANIVASRAMSEFHAVCRQRKVQPHMGFDAKTKGKQTVSVHHDQRNAVQSGNRRVPFQHVACPIGASSIDFDVVLRWIDENWSPGSNVNDPCIVHYIPKFIEVRPLVLRNQIIGVSDLDHDMMDAILRRIGQIDDQRSDGGSSFKWRHFIESDFMTIALAGWRLCDEASIIDQFIGSHLTYDVTRCSLLLFPAILRHHWVCYAWNMIDNRITVFDPWHGCYTVEELSYFHEQMVQLLKSSMKEIAQTLFIGWDNDWLAADFKLFSASALISNCKRSGAACAKFCMKFDGVGAVIHLFRQQQIHSFSSRWRP